MRNHSGVYEFSVFWLLFSLLITVLVSGYSSWEHSLFAVLCVISYAICIYGWYKTGNRVISLFSFFVVYAFFCNCSQQILYVFGVPEIFLTSYYDVSFPAMVNMLRYQYVCISALNMGMMLYVRKKKNCIAIEHQIQVYKEENYHNSPKERILYLFLLLCFAGTALAAYKTALVRNSMSYAEYMDSGYESVNVMFYFSYFFAFLSLRSVFKKQNVFLIYCAWGVIACVYMMLGLRTQAIPYVSYFIICLPITHPGLFKKKFIPLWVVMGVSFVIILGWISATRSIEGAKLSSESQGVSLDLIRTISDVGSSSQTIGITIKSVDEGLGVHQSIIYFLLTVVPTKVLKIPSSIFETMIGNDQACISPGTFMSSYVGGYGLGFSFIAEAYLNFKWLGWIYVMLYGYIIAALENYSYKSIMKGDYFPIAFLLILCRQIFYARADLWLCGSYIEYMIFTYILYRIINYKTKRI